MMPSALLVHAVRIVRWVLTPHCFQNQRNFFEVSKKHFFYPNDEILTQNSPKQSSKPILFQVKPQGTMCRNAQGDCDLDEFCDGKSGECPSDLYIKNGKSCIDSNGEQGFCFNGDCPTRTKQCQVEKAMKT